MGLKGFHVFFVCVATLCAFGFGGWAVLDYQRTSSGGTLAMAVLSFVAAVALVFYGLWFLRKLKNVGYL